MPAEGGAAGAGSALHTGPQPAAGGGAAEEESICGEGGAAAGGAVPAAGRLREERGAGAAAAHAAGAGAEEPEGPPGEGPVQNLGRNTFSLKLDEKMYTLSYVFIINVKIELGVDWLSLAYIP